ncbi:MAG: tyrosine--tRNA ligase [Kofleriaceae bacterium]|jgi:tyrosyl-tRNA synthetase|nr:tyrosine--tRNA ligase [Kofleriaceae bacterium]MBP9168224.1 tyrosine--tRNA ligase [Kofleriaceae bacterium]MBP9856398.1 tyrosine--tRNA ligase [Kofleriaceae bacterium]
MTADILSDLEARGLIADVTNRAELGAAFAAGNVPHYAGHDPTATSLHIGHLIPIVIQRRLQLAGHRPIAVVGGATGMIGDPSGRSTERNLLDRDTLAANVAGIRAQLGRLLDFDAGAAGAVLVNNADWFAGVSFLDFLRDVGKHVTINYMLAKDSVRSRLEDRDSGLSYTEFSYMLLQAWDFVVLARDHGCRLQVGGSDQWGNITAGCELARRLGAPQLYGLTAPLLLDGSGQKMGKTSTGERVWLDPALTTSYAMYQYLVNVDDAVAPSMLRKFSFRALAELEPIIAEHEADRSKRHVQRELARDLTRWIHGDAGLRAAENATAIMFGGSLVDAKDADLAPLGSVVGTTAITRAELDAGLPLVDLLVRAELVASKGEARRLISQGGVYVNNQREAAVDRKLDLSALGTESYIFLRSGKKNYRLIHIA